MERREREEILIRLGHGSLAVGRFIGRLFVPRDVQLCQSEHYDRTHFVPQGSDPLDAPVQQTLDWSVEGNADGSTPSAS